MPIHLHQAYAEELPFSDASFDTVISTLVFCTIPNPFLALKEIHRVAKEGANILFLEHVRMKHRSIAKA